LTYEQLSSRIFFILIKKAYPRPKISKSQLKASLIEQSTSSEREGDTQGVCNGTKGETPQIGKKIIFRIAKPFLTK
jgi:hypothetical protein